MGKKEVQLMIERFNSPGRYNNYNGLCPQQHGLKKDKEKIREYQGKMDESTSIVRDYNMSLSKIDVSCSQKRS